MEQGNIALTHSWSRTGPVRPYKEQSRTLGPICRHSSGPFVHNHRLLSDLLLNCRREKLENGRIYQVLTSTYYPAASLQVRFPRISHQSRFRHPENLEISCTAPRALPPDIWLIKDDPGPTPRSPFTNLGVLDSEQTPNTQAPQ